MTQFFAKAALAALIGFGGLGAMSATASAATIDFGITGGDTLTVQYRDRDRHDRGWGRDDRRSGRDDRGWRRPDRGGRCTPWLATQKAAERYGLRRPQVVDMTPRRVVVEGRQRGRYVTVVFANDRGCPTLGR